MARNPFILLVVLGFFACESEVKQEYASIYFKRSPAFHPSTTIMVYQENENEYKSDWSVVDEDLSDTSKQFDLAAFFKRRPKDTLIEQKESTVPDSIYLSLCRLLSQIDIRKIKDGGFLRVFDGTSWEISAASRRGYTFQFSIHTVALNKDDVEIVKIMQLVELLYGIHSKQLPPEMRSSRRL